KVVVFDFLVEFFLSMMGIYAGHFPYDIVRKAIQYHLMITPAESLDVFLNSLLIFCHLSLTFSINTLFNAFLRVSEPHLLAKAFAWRQGISSLKVYLV